MQAALRRTPGIFFETVPQVDQSVLPRLDEAGFVGFATRGPCDVAVPIEDLAGFDAIFGGRLALARGSSGTAIYALLRDAVGGFFAAGGRRCHVIRIAGGTAARARFGVPGLIAIEQDNTHRATIDAAWPGAWSDDLKLGTVLDVTPLPPERFIRAGDLVLDWDPASAPQAVQAGDLLRLIYATTSLLFPVVAATAIQSAQPSSLVADQGSTRIRLSAQRIWRVAAGLDGGATITAAALLGRDGRDDQSVSAQMLNGLVQVTGADTAGPDDMIRLDFADQSKRVVSIAMLATLAETGRVITPGEVIELRAAGGVPPTLPSEPLQHVERVRFALRIKSGNNAEQRIGDLGCNGGHPRFWGDAAAGGSGVIGGTVLAPGSATRFYDELSSEDRAEFDWTDERLRTVASALLAPASTAPVYLPLGMPLLTADLTGPAVTGADGLQEFDERPFLDTALEQAFPPSEVIPSRNPRWLLEAATNRRFVQNRKLKGIYALLFIDEVALVSVPDAVQRRWRIADLSSAPSEVPVSPPAPSTEGFSSCPGVVPLLIISISPAAGPLSGGTEVTIAGAGFGSGDSPRVSIGGRVVDNMTVLDDNRIQCLTPPATLIGAADVELRRGTDTAFLTRGFTYFAEATLPPLPVVTAIGEYDLTTLVRVQAALTVMCQARGDAVAVLSLPRHFQKREAIGWLQRLRAERGLPSSGPAPGGLSIDPPDLSYVVVYHPWLLVSDTLGFAPRQEAVPPDGTACGLIAAREIAREAWVAPANLPVPGVLDLEPEISDSDWLDLYSLGFNLVRAEAKDFRVMSAHTLADDPSLMELSVRRLLIQLRKAALERGQNYVFDSNTQAFRQRVRTGLEALLRYMFNRGAFAGASEPLSFHIAMDESLNTPRAVADGQMIAQIRIAPSLPTEFLTVLLSRNAEGALQAAER